MKVIQTNEFSRAVKKLPKQLKVELDTAVKAIMANPLLGDAKVADLAGIRVYKFKMNKQLTLLGYEYDGETVTLYLLKLGSHENFYRDLKNTRAD
jgi:mRNA-degrading endonuclease RelE of RelBE toxin-antitoxin system